MAKANPTHIANWKTVRNAALAAVAATAVAGVANAQAAEPSQMVLPGKDSDGDPISAVGQKFGLELYDRDAADPCHAARTQVRVLVDGVRPGGILKLELFGEDDFLKSEGKLRKVRIPAADAPMLVCMDVPGAGQYAVVGYHDVDGDRRLDKKWNFKPKEPYGLSNNPSIQSLRLPKWEETNFSVPEGGTTIAINLVDAG